MKVTKPWVQVRGPALLNVEGVEENGRRLRGVRLYRLNNDFRLTSIVDAGWADYQGTEASDVTRLGEPPTLDGWTLHDGVERRFLPNGNIDHRPFGTMPLPLSQVPRDFESAQAVESESLTLTELAAYIDRLQQDGYPSLNC